uniref:Conserved oligomeric Golgi complex subunit 5 helical domain-containing protein n=2 Tax=Kalmanozyma brasiliensis (strain GHG001) TaxID=1365824 RepID=V5E491_KALBG
MEVVFGKGEKRDGEGEDAAVGQVHGRDLARAASLVAEITSLLDAEPKPSTSQPEDAGSASLHDLKLIQDLLPTITTARKTIVDYMEDMIVRGLRDLSPLMLGSSLQTAFNLRILPTLVQDLLNDLTQVVRERTAAAFDLDILSRQLQLPLPTLDAPAPTYSTYRSGRRSIGNTEDELKQQHHHQQQVWSEAVWKKLESLIVTEMGAVCSKVYLLEKVLKLKSDGETGVNFLGAALEVLGDKPSHTFWMTFAQSLREQVTLATGKSAWLAQLLSGGVRAGEGYPKFIRLFQEFFAKISLYTDVQYTTTHQSAETVILLKSLGGLETAYVEKSTGRIAEILSQVASPSGGRRPSVGEEEAGTVVRSITNVLDTTRFDPLLERAVVARCSALIDHFVSRLDSLTAKDDSAWTLTGDAGSPTQAQMWNASLVQFAYTLSQGLLSLAADQDGSAANAPSFASTRLATSASSIQNATRTTLLDPLLSHINTSLSSTMAKMHVQLASANASAEKKRGVSIDSTTGASGYATSICETLSYLRDELLPLYLSALRSAIAGRIARWVVELFCLHASVVALPLAEGGERVKLRLATDMTEFEFALTQLVGDHFVARTSVSASAWIVEEKGLVGQGDWMRTTKAFRRLLFLSLDEVEQETKGQALGLPSLLVVLHLFSRQSEVLDGVLRETLAIAVVGKKGKAQNVRSDFVGWVRSTSQSEVSGTITEALPDDAGLDETTDRIVRSLLAQS